jgi:hypothetical protein
MDLFGDISAPSLGLLITTLVDNKGVRLQAFDFSTFTPISGTSPVVDTNTIGKLLIVTVELYNKQTNLLIIIDVTHSVCCW